MHKLVLKRRELVQMLEHNSFVALGRRGTSHVRYRGVIDGVAILVTIDESIDEYQARSHTALYYIVSTELGFFGEGRGSANEGWERFYAGHPDIARRAGVTYRKWDRENS